MKCQPILIDKLTLILEHVPWPGPVPAAGGAEMQLCDSFVLDHYPYGLAPSASMLGSPDWGSCREESLHYSAPLQWRRIHPKQGLWNLGIRWVEKQIFWLWWKVKSRVANKLELLPSLSVCLHLSVSPLSGYPPFRVHPHFHSFSLSPNICLWFINLLTFFSHGLA